MNILVLLIAFFKDKIELFESEAFDNKMASVRILGQEMAEICLPDTFAEIKSILCKETSETSNYDLIVHIMGNTFNFDEILSLLLKLKQGFCEVVRSDL